MQRAGGRDALGEPPKRRAAQLRSTGVRSPVIPHLGAAAPSREHEPPGCAGTKHDELVLYREEEP
jgi:hypothetical protein